MLDGSEDEDSCFLRMGSGICIILATGESGDCWRCRQTVELVLGGLRPLEKYNSSVPYNKRELLNFQI